MTGLPTEMIDRWEHRAEPAPGEGLIYWHMLLGDNADAVALAQDAQQRVAGFSGLHMTPLTWLHMTALIAGPAADLTSDQIDRMADTAALLLADVAPVAVTLGKILYHPEAIMLAARPADALLPVVEAARQATRDITGTEGRAGNKLPWTPHATICYSEARQPAQPIISALGLTLPERRIQVSTISLVHQHGPERRWDWTPVATVKIGSGLSAT